MPYRAIATDYDGTLANDGFVDEATWTAMAAFGQSGRQIILVTGRQLNDLTRVCPRMEQFAAVVAENGAVLHWPSSGQTQLLGEPPPPEFIHRLQQAGVKEINRGEVIVATWQPHGATVQATLTAMQLDFQVILNKRAVMVLPQGVDKALGLKTALTYLHIAPEEVVGIGDAENDIPLLQTCGLGVAVGNALPELKAIADYTTTAERGAGVQEFIKRLL